MDIQMLLRTQQFRRYVDSLPNPDAFLEKLGLPETQCKLTSLEEAFPEEFNPEQVKESLLLNLQQDYDSMVSDLPPDFRARESKAAIHVGNTNQIEICYDGKINNKINRENVRIACIGLHFRDIGNARLMYFENVQGELKEGGYYSRREVRRIFGKLNSHFGDDWRVGILRQLIKYAHNRDMEVRGQVPGLFYFFASSITQYPLYSLNYVQTYLKSGISLEHIEFKPIDHRTRGIWPKAMVFLATKNQEERLGLIRLAAGEYAQSRDYLRHQWLKEKTIDCETFDESCEEEFARVFEKYFA